MRTWLLLGLLAARPALATDAPVVLLLPFEDRRGGVPDAILESSLPDLLAAHLGLLAGAPRLVDRQKFLEAAGEKALATQGWTEKSRGAAKALGARYILRGSLLGLGDRWELQASLLEIETTRLVQTFRVRGPSGKAAPLVEALAKEIAAKFPAGLATPDLPPKRDPEPYQLLITALGHFYQGRWESAAPVFLEILEADPRHAAARYWLARCFMEAGWRENARVEVERFRKDFPRDPRAAALDKLLGKKP